MNTGPVVLTGLFYDRYITGFGRQPALIRAFPAVKDFYFIFAFPIFISRRQPLMMFLFSLLLISLMAYPNVRLANRVGQNGLLWGFISVIFYFIFQTVFGLIFFFAIYKGPVEPAAVQQFFMTKPLVSWAILLFGIGGILLARFILEQIGKKRR